MKKRLFALAAVVALFAASAVPAFAHDIPQAAVDGSQICERAIETVIVNAVTGISHAQEDVAPHLIEGHVADLCLVE